MPPMMAPPGAPPMPAQFNILPRPPKMSGPPSSSRKHNDSSYWQWCHVNGYLSYLSLPQLLTSMVTRLNIILICLSPSLTSWKKLECIVEVPVFEELNLGERTYSLGHHLLSYSTRKFCISSTISLSLPYCIGLSSIGTKCRTELRSPWSLG